MNVQNNVINSNQKLETTTCISNDEQVFKNEVYPHNGKIIISNKIISVTKRNKVLIHSTTQVNLANVEDSHKKV